jgi:ribose transport system permease protein
LPRAQFQTQEEGTWTSLGALAADIARARQAFTVLAGIVVGGTSIVGGEGAAWRTFLGVLFIALIGNGYDLLGLDPLYEQITLGVILLAAVAIDSWARRRRG